MHERLNAIIALFENDDGGKWTREERAYAERKWDALPEVSREFLIRLSIEDLDNVCCGERRGENDVLYNGRWQPLSPIVDAFLNDIWRNM